MAVFLLGLPCHSNSFMKLKPILLFLMLDKIGNKFCAEFLLTQVIPGLIC
jgi:hypothetical protein